MPVIRPIPAIVYRAQTSGDVSALIAPPYDVLDEAGKAKLQGLDTYNIVTIDLPHLPAKTVGPDAVYEQAGLTYRAWLEQGVLQRRAKPAMFAYRQTYEDHGRTIRRMGLIANVGVQEFGKSPDGRGGIHPHEQTFSGPKEDRLKLMRATGAQLSPIFGLHDDPQGRVNALIEPMMSKLPATMHGRTAHDGVLHEVWAIEDAASLQSLAACLAEADIFIADGHHRYNTALNYRRELATQQGSPLAADHPAQGCLFVLVAMQDPGMLIWPTHRVLGGLQNFSINRLAQLGQNAIGLEPFSGSLQALEKALAAHGPHAMGVYVPAQAAQKLWIMTTRQTDPLAESHGQQSAAWRQLDVAIVQHLLVEKICQPHFSEGGQPLQWKFPHTLADVEADAHALPGALALILQPTPLQAVRQVSQAGELMPQKSTFFYPKLATGLVINPLR